MIRYNLACKKGHGFESWFQSSDAYDKQAKRGLVTCPVCGSDKVEKALMVPQVKRTDRGRPNVATDESGETANAPGKAPVALLSDQEREFRSKLKELRDHLTTNADYVGGKFPEEARKMHYGETDHRSIYGEASAEDAKELHDEGIAFHALPTLPGERN